MWIFIVNKHVKCICTMLYLFCIYASNYYNWNFLRLFFQVVECCHFLSQTSIGRLEMDSNKEKDSFVTLLTGSKTLLSGSNTNGFSPLGVTNSAGILLCTKCYACVVNALKKYLCLCRYCVKSILPRGYSLTLR